MNPDATSPVHPDILRLVPQLKIARTFWQRAMGLMGKRRLAAGHGMLFPHCRSIHTCFMRFPLDVIFLDGENRPVKIIRNLKPWRMARGGSRARSVLEVQSGWLPPGI